MPKLLERVSVAARQSFGRWVEEQYFRRGWSQREFASRIGVAHPTVSRWISKGLKPERAVCYRIADALGLEVDEVLERADHIVDTPKFEPMDGGVELVPLTPADYAMIEELRASGRRLRAEAKRLEAQADAMEESRRQGPWRPPGSNNEAGL